MEKTIQYNLILSAIVVLMSAFAVQNASAQTKLYDLDLYSDSISVDFSPDGSYLATGDVDGYVNLWEVGSGENIYYRSLGGQVAGVAFDPSGTYIAADGSDDEGVRSMILNASSGTVIDSRYINEDADNINSVAYSPDGRYVAVGLDIRWAYLWELSSGRAKGWGKAYAYEVYDVAFSPDGRYLATGNDNGDATLWELNSWWTDDVNTIDFKPGGNVRAVAFSPNGKYLAADAYDGNKTSVAIYDVVSRRIVRQIDPDIYEVNALAFSPDGLNLAVGGTNPEIIIYRIGTDDITPLTAITKEATVQTSGEVHDLAWSPDGGFISDGKAVYRYRMPAAFSPKIKLASHGIEDFWALGDGNGNGVIEPGERITFTVKLKNEGDVTAQDVIGILSADNNSVHISDNNVSYGNIRPSVFSTAPLLDKFKVEIPSVLVAQVVKLTLTVTADNGGPWTIPIELKVINPAKIGITTFPENLISEEAFSTNATYFILKAQYPTLTGVESEISYGGCTITLHIPDGTKAFIFPVKTEKEKLTELGIEALVFLASKKVPILSTLFDMIEFFEKIENIGERDLEIKLYNPIFDRKRPDAEIEYVVLLKNEVPTLRGIDITLEQEYRLGDGSTESVSEREFWAFR